MIVTIGGGCVEFAGTSNTFKDFNHLTKILDSKDYQNNKNIFCDWDTCMKHLEAILEGSVLNER